MILFSADSGTSSAILRVPASGGQPVALAPSGPGTVRGRGSLPVFLLYGRHYLAVAREGAAGEDVRRRRSTRRERTAGAEGVTGPERDTPSATVTYVFVRGTAASMAQRFDADQPAAVRGEAFPGRSSRVADADAGSGSGNQIGSSSASHNGVLTLQAGATAVSRLAWFDRAGKRLRVESMTGSLQAPSLTRDGKRLAIERTDAAGTHVWVIDLVAAPARR